MSDSIPDEIDPLRVASHYPAPPEGSGVKLVQSSSQELVVKLPWDDNISCLIEKIIQTFFWATFSVCIMMMCITGIWPNGPDWTDKLVLCLAACGILIFCFGDFIHLFKREEIRIGLEEIKFLERSWCGKELSQIVFPYSSSLKVEYHKGRKRLTFEDHGVSHAQSYLVYPEDTVVWLRTLLDAFFQQRFPEVTRSFITINHISNTEFVEKPSLPRFNSEGYLNLLEELSAGRLKSLQFTHSSRAVPNETSNPTGVIILFSVIALVCAYYAFSTWTGVFLRVFFLCSITFLWFDYRYQKLSLSHEIFTLHLEEGLLTFKSNFSVWYSVKRVILPNDGVGVLYYHPEKKILTLVKRESSEILYSFDCEKSAYPFHEILYQLSDAMHGDHSD